MREKIDESASHMTTPLRQIRLVRALIERQIAWSIPPGLEPPLYSRARLTVVFAAVFSTVAGGYLLLHLSLRDFHLAGLAAMAGLLMLGAPGIMRVTRSVPVAVHMLVFGVWLSVMAAAIAGGGLSGPAIGWLALVSTGALFLAGRGAGHFWFMTSSLSAVLLLTLDLHGGVLHAEVAGALLSVRRFIALMVEMTVALALMQLYEAEKERMLEVIRAANRDITASRDRAVALAAELAEAQTRIVEEARRQRQLEIELRHAQKLEGLGRLAAGVAHELNTPLQFVSDSVSFAHESVGELAGLIAHYQATVASHHSPEEFDAAAAQLAEEEERVALPYLLEHVPTALTRAADGLARMANIVKALKNFAYSDSAASVPGDLNDALQTTLVVAAHELRGIAEVRTEFGVLPRVACVVGELNQVFLNLIVNAAHAIADVPKSGDARGIITIRTELRGEDVVISVSDTGGGIPDEVLPRIFEPFVTTKEVGRGSGQGLAIARAIVVDRHGGSLDFETERGRGTTFRVTLPTAGMRASKSQPSGLRTKTRGPDAAADDTLHDAAVQRMSTRLAAM